MSSAHKLDSFDMNFEDIVNDVCNILLCRDGNESKVDKKFLSKLKVRSSDIKEVKKIIKEIK